MHCCVYICFFFFQAEDGIRDLTVTGVQTCALPILTAEEAYFADSVKYTATTACTTPPTAGAVNFCVTTGNNLGTVGLAAGNGSGGHTSAHHTQSNPLWRRLLFNKTAVFAPAGSEKGPPRPETAALGRAISAAGGF